MATAQIGNNCCFQVGGDGKRYQLGNGEQPLAGNLQHAVNQPMAVPRQPTPMATSNKSSRVLPSCSNPSRPRALKAPPGLERQ
ncbi:hypothetical protein AAF134_14670 [Synechococcus lacustris Tous-12m]